jgi:hypothetical protein
MTIPSGPDPARQARDADLARRKALEASQRSSAEALAPAEAAKASGAPTVGEAAPAPPVLPSDAFKLEPGDRAPVQDSPGAPKVALTSDAAFMAKLSTGKKGAGLAILDMAKGFLQKSQAAAEARSAGAAGTAAPGQGTPATGGSADAGQGKWSAKYDAQKLKLTASHEQLDGAGQKEGTSTVGFDGREGKLELGHTVERAKAADGESEAGDSFGAELGKDGAKVSAERAWSTPAPEGSGTGGPDKQQTTAALSVDIGPDGPSGAAVELTRKQHSGTQQKVSGSFSATDDGFEGKVAASFMAKDRCTLDLGGGIKSEGGVGWAATDDPDRHRMTVWSKMGASASLGLSQYDKDKTQGGGFGLALSAESGVAFQSSVTDAEKQKLASGEAPAVKVPTLAEVSDPEKVTSALSKPGDTITFSASGSFSLTLKGTYGGVSGGVKAAVSGKFETQVENLGDEKVRLRVSPKSGAQVEVFAGDSAGVIKGTVSAGREDALTQEFVFDLKTKEGKEAYEKAMKGHLPPPFAAAEMQGDAAEVARRMAERGSPVGYYPTKLGQSEATTLGTALEVGGFKTSDSLKSKSSRDVEFQRDEQGRLQAVEVTDAQLKAREKGSDTLWSGRRAETSSAEMLIKTTHTEGEAEAKRELVGINMEEVVSDSKTSTQEMNQTLAAIRDATEIKHLPNKVYGSEGWGDTQVSLRARITPEQIDQLAKLEEPSIEALGSLADDQRSTLQLVVSEMRAAGANASNEAERQIAQAKVLGEHLKSNAGEWMGILHHAIGLQPELTASSAAFTKPVVDTSAFVQKHGSTLPRTVVSHPQDAHRLAEQLVGAAQIRKDIDKGFVRITSDPYLTKDEKNAHRAKLMQSTEQLARMTDVSRLDGASRGKLIQALLEKDQGQGMRGTLLEAIRTTPPEQAAEVLEALELKFGMNLTLSAQSELAGLAIRGGDWTGLKKVVDWNPSKGQAALRSRPDSERDLLPPELRRAWRV